MIVDANDRSFAGYIGRREQIKQLVTYAKKHAFLCTRLRVYLCTNYRLQLPLRNSFMQKLIVEIQDRISVMTNNESTIPCERANVS